MKGDLIANDFMKCYDCLPNHNETTKRKRKCEHSRETFENKLRDVFQKSNDYKSNQIDFVPQRQNELNLYHPIGLDNLGNTCFMVCFDIQILIYSHLFIRLFISIHRIQRSSH